MLSNGDDGTQILLFGFFKPKKERKKESNVQGTLSPVQFFHGCAQSQGFYFFFFFFLLFRFYNPKQKKVWTWSLLCVCTLYSSSSPPFIQGTMPPHRLRNTGVGMIVWSKIYIYIYIYIHTHTHTFFSCLFWWFFYNVFSWKDLETLTETIGVFLK